MKLDIHELKFELEKQDIPASLGEQGTFRTEFAPSHNCLGA